MGHLSPLLGFEGLEGRIYVFSGSRRRDAAALLGSDAAPALALARGPQYDSCFKALAEAPPDPAAWKASAVFPEEADFRAFASFFLSALAENADRGFNEAESAALGPYLAFFAGDPREAAIAKALNLASPARRAGALVARKLGEPIFDALSRGILSLENLSSLNGFDAREREIIVALLTSASPSFQNRRLWLEWLADLRERGDFRLEDFLAALNLAPPRRPTSQETRDALFRERFPALASYLKRRDARVRALRLPPEARLELDGTLEDLSATLRLKFDDPARLDGILARLIEERLGAKLGEIFALPWLES